MSAVRLRVRFTKLGKVRFIGHRDLARVWERAVRKAGLPISYSQGFSPRARLSFGLALSTGYESDAEYVDLDLDATLDHAALAALPARLSHCLPSGVDVTAVALVATNAPSLQQAVTSCAYTIELTPDRLADVAHGDFATQTAEAVGALAAAPVLVVERSRKGVASTDDIRPGVLSVQLAARSEQPEAPGVRLAAELSAQPRAVRPADLCVALAALGAPPAVARVRRTHQYIALDGLRSEPLTADSSADGSPTAPSLAGANGAALLPAPAASAPAPREEHSDVRLRRRRTAPHDGRFPRLGIRPRPRRPLGLA